VNVNFQLNKKLQAYVEWYVLSPTGSRIERTQHYSDGGFAYQLTNNFQVDIEVGVGLNAAANEFFAGAGAVVRF
jgi:hypothetical protein